MRRTHFIPHLERLEGKLMLAGDGPVLPPGGLAPEPPAMETGSSSVSVAFRTEHIGFSNYLIVKVGGDQQREIEIVDGAEGTTDANGEVQLWYPHGKLTMDVAMRGASGEMEPLATLNLDYSGRIIDVIAAASAALSGAPTTNSPILLSVDPTTVLHDALHAMPAVMPAMASTIESDSMDAMAVDMAMDVSGAGDSARAAMPGMQMAMPMSMEGDMSAHGATATHAGADAIADSDDVDAEHSDAVAASRAPLPQSEPIWDEDYYPEEAASAEENADTVTVIQLTSAELPVIDSNPSASAADLLHEVMLPIELPLAEASDEAVVETEPQAPSYLARAGYAAVAIAATAGAIACDRLANRAPPRAPRRRPAWLGGFLVRPT